MKKIRAKESFESQQGFTLIEILVAVVILVFGLLAVGTMQISAIRGNFMSGNTSAALTLASEKMEDLLNRDYADAGLADTAPGNNGSLSSITTTDHEEGVDMNGQVVGAGSGFYRRIWNIADAAAPMPTAKYMTIIVTWENNKHRVSVSCLRKQ
jgi:prepilin-type N-terminal cleavage/methylation domain-containing protein